MESMTKHFGNLCTVLGIKTAARSTLRKKASWW